MTRYLFKLMGAALLAASLLLAGCAAGLPRPYADQRLRGAEGLRMAILPFDNLSKSQGAAKTMENVVLTEFLKAAPVKVVDPGEVATVLSQERVRLSTSIPRETVKRIGKKLEVNLLMVGILHEYDSEPSSGAGGTGQIPVVSTTLRIIDANTAEIVWASTAARRGNDRESVFGIGRINSISTLAEVTARELATAFGESLKK